MEERLAALARNLWWTWHPEAVEVWRGIDPELWRQCRHSPVTFMRRLGRERLARLGDDPAFRIKLHRVTSDLQRYLHRATTWGSSNAGPLRARPVVYFCAELGIHESMPLYSGGLGVLAGDLLKSASDLGIPMIGISLFYREGYFRQRLSETGGQIADYETIDPGDLPLVQVNDPAGKPLVIELPIQGERVKVGAWTADLGLVPVYFLDMAEAFREMGIQELGLRLYGGGEAVRLTQEIILGIGGMRLLLSLGIQPGAIHLNEGHCALAPLEYARHLMAEHGLSFEAARRQAAGRTVFTTHTPVAAGHDRFAPELVEHLLGSYRQELGIGPEELLALGRIDPQNRMESFCMTVLALKMASRANAVSSIHGKVSRDMWRGLTPERPCQEVPIGHITNGIHVLGWLAPLMQELFHRYFPPDWQQRIGREEVWLHIQSIPDEELWNTVLLMKTRFLRFLPREPHRAWPQNARLNPRALTIGFARRFAAYKRADLLLADPARLKKLLTDPARPVQMIFSGKAHPRDEEGGEMLGRVYRFATDPELRDRVVFIEDYDINVGRHLVQGVDLWLNTPVQGMEACGTSGMKVALNGGLNLSILDGWWPEGFDSTNGFAVSGSRHPDPAVRDGRDREAIFRALEEEVVPLYYRQEGGEEPNGVPHGWVAMLKRAMCTLGWRFSADRMVKDYTIHCYRPGAGISTAEMSTPFV
ncbi:MAG: alpha-glucan family phosphorylase [Desulfobacteraceae bacterium]|nr:alpha-glucan family phosphorylase [Desulfobacteraceae bacterium]